MAAHERVTVARPTVVHSCWLCGIRLPASQMMADGGASCTDVRWYCRDARACTARWTVRPQRALQVTPERPEPEESA